eukprot:1143797-Pelagomonas_calceolata.AAC.1
MTCFCVPLDWIALDLVFKVLGTFSTGACCAFGGKDPCVVDAHWRKCFLFGGALLMLDESVAALVDRMAAKRGRKGPPYHQRLPPTACQQLGKV